MHNQNLYFLEQLSSEPAENLALEDYFLHHKKDNFFFLYENKSSVIIGKHQNVFQEVQMKYCKEHHVQVFRRLSGGGTVFHGPGNINFTFIENLEPGAPMIDFRKYLAPMIDALASMGVDAEWSGRNDLLHQGYKISGNAQHVYQKGRRVIHHGTLLFDANLKVLKPTIAPKQHMSFTSHAVQSVRSPVRNIKSFSNSSSSKDFQARILESIKKNLKATKYVLTNKDRLEIKELVASKYSKDSWNVDYTPKFSCKMEHELFGPASVEIQVQKGAVISSAFYGMDNEQLPVGSLVGKPFSPETFADYFPFEQFGLAKPKLEHVQALF